MTEAAPSETLLIVDDTAANLRLLSQMLLFHGFRVRAANSGAQALESVEASRPDLILLDIMMPKMDGYEVCRRLKDNPQTAGIPIIFLSALGATEDKIHAFTAGAVDYITKPFQIEEVLARIRTHLDLRRLQQDLQQQIAERDQLIAERDQLIAELDAFAHTVAHDLKNPLHSMMGCSNFLIGQDDVRSDENLAWASDALVRIGEKMNNIIEELLLLAGVRKRQVVVEPLDMAAIVGEAQARLARLIEETGAQITLPATWPTAAGHGPWIEEVWVNYLGNACKYGGQPPHIELGATDAAGIVRFWVRDRGPGISADDQEKLFVPFTRLAQVRTEGYGLGLSIVQRIVDRLGGQVGVESEPGAGSTFYFTLPAAAP